MENNVFVLMQKRAVATTAINSKVFLAVITAFISGTWKNQVQWNSSSTKWAETAVNILHT